MSRSYEIDGQKYPSVTTILDDYGNKNGLIQWSANCVVEYVRDHLDDIRNGDITADDIDLERAKNYYKEKSQEALDIGSAVHSAIEKSIISAIEYPDILKKMSDLMIYRHDGIDISKPYGAFCKWADKNHFKPFASEMTVYSKKYGFAGTLDMIARVNGKVYVIDLKTSKRHDNIHSVQIAAYRKAFLETGSKDIPTPEGCAVLRLDKETGEP